MKEIQLSLSYYKAINQTQGPMAAIYKLREDIQLQTKFPIRLQVGILNDDSTDMMAAFERVRVSTKDADGWISSSSTTCGIGETAEQAFANLFTVLSRPQNWNMYPKAGQKSGLLVGSSADPAGFITFDR